MQRFPNWVYRMEQVLTLSPREFEPGNPTRAFDSTQQVMMLSRARFGRLVYLMLLMYSLNMAFLRHIFQSESEGFQGLRPNVS